MTMIAIGTTGYGQRPAERCVVCGGPMLEARIVDPDDGGALHPGCLVERLPHDALSILLGALALVVAPVVIVWAG
jgi:hypothetical protein